MHVHRWGDDGPEVLLVHGDGADGETSWRRQRPLAASRQFHVVDRPGHGGTPRRDRVDFEDEADLLAEVLPVGSHLVGHSYGAVVSLVLACRHPGRVRSLVISEPPAYGLAAATDADAAELMASMDELWDDTATAVEPWFDRLADLLAERKWPDGLPPRAREAVSLMRGERRPWEARPDLGRLARGAVPVLVLSSGAVAGIEGTCDVIARATGGSRALVPGSGHSVPREAARYNEVVAKFWSSVEANGQSGFRSHVNMAPVPAKR